MGAVDIRPVRLLFRLLFRPILLMMVEGVVRQKTGAGATMLENMRERGSI